VTTSPAGAALPALDEATRPRLPTPGAAATTAVGRANAQALVQIHDHLRAELDQVRRVVAQVAAGAADPAAARGLVNRLTVRSNAWQLGAFCAQYCRVLTVHHAIEDARMFPDVAAAAGAAEGPALTAVLERLGEEHEVVSAVLVRLDEALVAAVADPAAVAEVVERVEHLAAVLLSHLAYEEEQVLGPIARHSVVV